MARKPAAEGGGVPAIQRVLAGELGGLRPLAPPVLRAGDLVLAQSSAILAWLGPRLGLVPDGDDDRARVNALQLTVADLWDEVHETHHPIAVSMYYHDQKPEAARRAGHFVRERLPKFLGYFEAITAGPFVFGDRLTYVDLSLFQTLEGLAYAFPNALAALAPKLPRLRALRDAVAARPRVAAYLASPRRLACNQHGLFRHYPELDQA